MLNKFRRGDSTTWRLLCRGYSQLVNLLSWDVGNGQQISFLYDRWINGRALHLWPTFLNCNEVFPTHVAALMREDGGWDEACLGHFFGGALVEIILTTLLNGGTGEDKFIVEGRYGGRSLSSRIYRNCMEGVAWSNAWVWRLGLQPKVAFFWWRLCHDAVPTRLWLHTRGLSEVVACPWGCDSMEDLSHVVVSCKFMSSALDKLVAWGFHVPHFLSLPQVLAWLQGVGKNKISSPTALLFCTLVYHVWKNRLAKTHDRHVISARMTAAFALGDLTCGASSPIRFWDTLAPRGNVTRNWCPPPYGWLKVNMDGALLSDGRGGCAAVIRDHCGNLVVAKGRSLLHWDCAEVEMQALLLIRDFLMQWAMEGVGLMVEGDCAGVIAHLHQTYTLLQQKVMVEDIDTYSFLSLFHCIIFTHVPRGLNKLADCAAHVAMSGDFLWVDVLAATPRFCSILRDEVPSVNRY